MMQLLAGLRGHLKEDEREFGLRVIPVFLQPRVFFAHPSAKVKSLTADQLIGIFSGSHSQNWSEVGGPHLRVRVVRREEADSSLAVFRNTLPGWKELQFDKHRSKLAVTTQDAFETVKQHEGAIGFGPYNSKLDERLTVLSVNGISPLDPSYPSVIALSLIFGTRPSPKQRAPSSILSSRRRRKTSCVNSAGSRCEASRS